MNLMDLKLVLKYMVGLSNLGGTFSLGLKYAAILNENFAAWSIFSFQTGLWNNQSYGVLKCEYLGWRYMGSCQI